MIVIRDEPAFIVHKRPYHDTSSLVQFLTPAHGRITVVARQSSKMIGKTLQPFIPASVTCGGRGDMLTLRQFEPEGLQILVTTQQRMLGMYVNELLVKLTPARSRSYELFYLYKKCLADLVPNADIEKTLRLFELELLELTGNGLQLFYEHVSMEPVKDGVNYHYDMNAGPVQAERSDQPVYAGKTLIAMREKFDPCDGRILAEAKRLLRQAIDYHLEHKVIRTRSLFAYLQKLT